MKPYRYRDSIKSDVTDELVNVYLQRPVAGLVTHALYYTPVTPNAVTLLSLLAGIAGGVVLALPDGSLIIAAIGFYLKDILDSADGQLARAKGLYSRKGRFLDSIGDFLVNAALFSGIGVALAREGYSTVEAVLLGLVGFLGVTLRVSYYVFYQTSYLHREKQYANNRLTEEVTEEDRRGDKTTLFLQRVFQLMYGWQDRLMAAIDRWSYGKDHAGEREPRWYYDPVALRLSGLLGLGTEYVVLTLCLLFGNLWMYVSFTLIFFNIVWLSAISHRRFFLSHVLR